LLTVSKSGFYARPPKVGPWTAGQPGMATFAALSCAGGAQPGEHVQMPLAVAVPAMLIVLIVLAAPTGQELHADRSGVVEHAVSLLASHKIFDLLRDPRSSSPATLIISFACSNLCAGG